MERESGQGRDAGSIEDGHRVAPVLVGEPGLERRPGLPQLARLEQQAASPGLEHLIGPGLPVALRCLETVIGHDKGIRVAVQNAEDLAAPHEAETQPLVVAGINAVPIGAFDESSCRSEVVLTVFHGTLGELQGERGSNVAGRQDGLIRHGLHRPRLIRPARCHQVVIEARQVPGPQEIRDLRQVEGESARADPDLRRDREHPGDAEADLGLLVRLECLAQGPIRKADRFVAVARDVERDRGGADDLGAQWVVRRRDLQGASPELRRRHGVRRDQGLRRLQERGDGHLIAGHRARRQLHRHLDREGAAPQEDLRRPAVERPTSGRGDRLADGLPGDVVPERQAFSSLDEQVGFEELGDRCEQSRTAASRASPRALRT